jgi:hypothetical protein
MSQLTSIHEFNPENLRYGKPIMGTVPDSNPAVKTIRVPVTYKYSDGSYGPLMVSTGKVFSFGLGENVSQETQKVTGYSMPLCLYNRDGPTQDEILFVTVFNGIVESAKVHLVEHKEDVEKYELEMSDLKKFNPLYYKKIKGVPVPGMGPTLYAKCIMAKKTQSIMSMFYDSRTGLDINPLDLIGKYCLATSVIKFESVFLGANISYQIKLYECEVEQLQQSMKRVLPQVQSDPVVHIQPDNTSRSSSPENGKRPASPTSSLNGDGDSDGDEVIEKPTPAPAKRVVNRVTKKK